MAIMIWRKIKQELGAGCCDFHEGGQGRPDGESDMGTKICQGLGDKSSRKGRHSVR